MKDLVHFLKTTGLYLIGNVLTKAISFLMLPLYTKYLSPTNYGTYDVNIAYITFLSSVLFLDVWSGTMRFMFDYENQQKNKPILSGIFIFLSSTIVYAVASLVLGRLMSIHFILLVLLYGLVTNLQQFFSYILRGLSKNTLFVISGTLGSLVTVICNIIFIALFRYGYQYLYVSSIIGGLFATVIMLTGGDFKHIFKTEYIDFSLTWRLFKFSIPLTLNSVSWWFLTAYNRVVLTNRLSASANGLYAIANKFASIVQLVDQGFQMAWQEISFSKEGKRSVNNDAFFSTSINEYIKFMILGISLLMPLIKIVFPFVINSRFSDSLAIIPLALLATMCSSISSFLGSTLTAIKQNRYLFTTTVYGTIVNLIIIELTISVFKVQAASLALFIGYLVVDVRRYQLLKRYINLSIHKWKILFPIILLSLSIIVFFRFGILMNALSFIFIFLIAIYLYKDVLRKLLKTRF